MLVNINEILNNEVLPSIILLYGEEDLLIENSVKQLLSKVLKNDNVKFNFDMFDGDDPNSDVMKINDVCKSYPMMAERRVVLVKRFDKFFSGRTSKKTEQLPIIKYFDNPSPFTLLILTADVETAKDLSRFTREGKTQIISKKMASVKFPFNILIEKHSWIEYPKVPESEYPKWIISKFKEHKKSINETAAQLITAHCKQSLRDINNEINKLDTFTFDKKEITVDDVLLLVGSTREFNVFELQKAVGERNLRKSITILNKMLANDRQEMLILTILTKYFIVLWKLLDEANISNNSFQLAQRVGVFSTHLPEYQSALKRYKPNELDRAFIVLAETDLSLKTTGGDSLYLMQKMLMNIIQK